MSPRRRTTSQLLRVVIEPDLPLDARVSMVRQASLDGEPQDLKLIEALIETAGKASGSVAYEAQVEELQQKLQQLAQGPLRSATFRHMLGGLDRPDGQVGGSRASVILDDGSAAFVAVPDDELAGRLRRGDTVLVDQQGHAVLFRDDRVPRTGDLVTFERLLADGRVEVTTNNHERSILWAAASLVPRLESGEVAPGRKLIACSRRRMAFDAAPPADGLAHYVHLVKDAVPDVGLDDVGAAHPYVRELIELVRLEMTEPDLRRKYRLYRSVMRLLVGPSGTGKSYSIRALWHELYRVMSEATGVPVGALPPRVMRLRMPQVLSHWLGDSDKNLDRFFREVEQLAGDPWVAPDGSAHTLPVLCILEEIDGLARSRGQEPVYDRIMTTALERLDTTRPELRDKLILFVATTNIPGQVDPAFLRRVGGSVERFGRLGRDGFVAVLDKQLADRPLAGRLGAGDDARRRLINEVTAALYGPEHADAAQVELSYAGSTSWVPRYRRDFLTASIVDRAMQCASGGASVAEHRGEDDAPGLDAARLLEAIERQVRGVVDSLHESNVGDYVDLPDGVRVVGLRRPAPPAIASVALEAIN